MTMTKVKSDSDRILEFLLISDPLLPLVRSLEIPDPQITLNTYQLVIENCISQLFRKAI